MPRSLEGAIVRRRLGFATRLKHGEAYCLMKYARKDGSGVEWLWNSRDGVTPFGLGMADDALNHADWHEDIYCPNFVPPIGMRIFVSWEDAPTTYRVETHQRWIRAGKAAGRELPEGEPFGFRPFDPCVVVVDAALHADFARLAHTDPFVPA